VAKATHGETVADEVLGNGDASTGFQSFSTRKSPVTFVPQPGAPYGAANTLKVRVGGVLWHEVNTLYGHESDERVYTTAVDDEGVMTVQFGDGITGARLPTGRNNVVATYRQGLGRDGNVKANSLTTLLDRPVGLKSVTNPADAQGGADPETLDQARTNAPNTVRTFGRIVSLRDFENAAREFAGVAKALATWVWDGEEQVVHLTIAGDGGAKIAAGTPTYENLLADLNSRRDPNRKLLVEPYREVPVQIEAVIQVHSDYVAEDVRASAEKALEDYFAFDNLDLGQPIHLSNIYRVLQDVEGVVAVDINRLQFKNEQDQESHGATSEPVQGHLRIYPARLTSRDPVTIAPAELAVIKTPATDAIVNIG
jgi:predicted phage baseplate assembly protein